MECLTVSENRERNWEREIAEIFLDFDHLLKSHPINPQIAHAVEHS